MYASTNGSGQTLMDSVDNFANMIPTVRNDFANWTSKGTDDYELHVTEFGMFGSVFRIRATRRFSMWICIPR